MKALVTGATGFIGPRLLARLHQPVVLSRSASRAEHELKAHNARAFPWDPQKSPPPADAFTGIDTIFHLAGDPVASGRWSKQKKARIRDSRVLGTRHLVETLRGLNQRPQVLVCASAVGYYGDRGDEQLTEQSSPGRDFLAEVCVQWEREAAAARELGLRVVSIRIGVVLGPKGGALAQMILPFRLGLGSPLGSGRQYMPWIHRDDLVEMLLFAAKNDALNEPLNGVAPNPATNREFTKALGKAVHRPTFMPAIPGFAMKLAVGEFAQVLLSSQRVTPAAPQRHGFVFQFPNLGAALSDVIANWKSG